MAFDLTLDTVQVALVASGTDPVTGDWVTADWVRNAPTLKAPSLSKLSTEYRYFKVSATVVNNTTGLTESSTAYARILIGPGTGGSFAQTVKATLDAFTKVGDDPEVVVQKSGTIAFT